MAKIPTGTKKTAKPATKPTKPTKATKATKPTKATKATKPSETGSFDALTGKRADAKRLATYAAKAGARAAKLLDKIATTGNGVMRLAALEGIAAFDPARAEALAPEVMPMIGTQGDRDRLARLLLELGTDGATDLAIELAHDDELTIKISKLADAHRRRLYARTHARLDRLDMAGSTALHVLELGDVLDSPLVDETMRRDFASAIVAARADTDDDVGAGTRDPLRERAIQVLWSQGDPAIHADVLRGDGSTIPFAVRARVLLASDPVQAFDQLVDSFRRDASRRAVIVDVLDAKADPRWAHEVLALPDADWEIKPAALAKLRAADELVDLAARPNLDGLALHALHALAAVGDPRGSRLLVDWLGRPEGEERAPMILTALGSCGDAEALAVLEARLGQAGKRRAFYELAIDEIRTRLGA